MQPLQDLAAAAASESEPSDIIETALETVRRHLGMSVAYLSEFVDGRSVFRAVSAPGLEALIRPGDGRGLDEVYCPHIVAGRLPELIRDTREHPLAMAMPITAAVPIGSHVSVPIRRTDGTVFGMFCCLDPAPNHSLNDRDLQVMHLFAGLAAGQVNRALSVRLRREEMTAAIRAVMLDEGFRIVLQPIRTLADLRLSGFEALCRFAPTPYRPPNEWFADAEKVGLGAGLEVAVAARALDTVEFLPDGVYVSVNASPATVAAGLLNPLFDAHDPRRIVLEVTEQAEVADPDRIAAVLAPYRAAGLQLAVDDAGAGYAGLQHILRLRPDIIKLDMSLTRNIDSDSARRSLAAALVRFAAETGAVLVAEGIETGAELAALAALGVTRGQGYLLGRPGSLGDAMALAANDRNLPAVAAPAVA